MRGARIGLCDNVVRTMKNGPGATPGPFLIPGYGVATPPPGDVRERIANLASAP